MNHMTPRAQQVLALAAKESDRLHHHSVDTEHILLAIIRLRRGTAVDVLHRMGLNLQVIRGELERLAGMGPEGKASDNVRFTPRAKKVLALAGMEAKALNHSYLGTEHILLGLIGEDGGVAARVLKSVEVEIERTRMAVLTELDPNLTPQEEDLTR